MTALHVHTTEFGYGPARAARMESDRAMRRALPASFLFVTGLLLALAVAQRLVSPPSIAVDMGPVNPHQIILPGVVPPESRPTVIAPGPPVTVTNRVPLPVPDTSAPVAEPVAEAGSSDGPGVATGNPGIADGSEQGGTLAPDPEPGVFVYTDHLPERVFFVAPEYSDMARDAGVEGTVKLWALVDLDGSVKSVRVLSSVPLLDEAAAGAVRRWRFTPALANGDPVRVWVAVPVKFTLH